MILITGGLGFLGVGTARYLLGVGENVLLTRRRTSRIPLFLADHLDNKLRVVDGDVQDLPNLIAILEKYQVKSIIHAAMITQDRGSLYQGFKINLEGTVNVLEAARLAGIKRVSFISSATVYIGTKSEAPCKETMPVHLDGRHFITNYKIAGEALCSLYAAQYGLQLIITRPSMVYGPHSAAGLSPLELAVEEVVKKKSVVLSQFHPDYRMDFIYLDDCARAIGTLHLAKEPKYSVYNVASGKSPSLNEVANLIRKVMPDCHIELKGQRPPRYPLVLDISRLQEEFGYKPNYDLEQGIREYMGWVAQGRP